jgi:6-phosphogluconolactonase
VSVNQKFSAADPRVQLFTTDLEAFKFTAVNISSLINAAIHERGSANVILAAGYSIEKTLSFLDQRDAQWAQVKWFLADERCVDHDDEQRNQLRLTSVLKKSIGEKFGEIVGPNAHDSPEESASKYASRIEAINMFDFCLLGMGNDGHIASLLPNHPALDSKETCFVVNDSPYLPKKRITLTLESLARSENRILITTGASKQKAIKDFVNNPQAPVRLFDPTAIIADQVAYK